MIICVLCKGRAFFHHFDKQSGIKRYHCLDCQQEFFGSHRTPAQKNWERDQEEAFWADHKALRKRMEKKSVESVFGL